MAMGSCLELRLRADGRRESTPPTALYQNGCITVTTLRGKHAHPFNSGMCFGKCMVSCSSATAATTGLSSCKGNNGLASPGKGGGMVTLKQTVWSLMRTHALQKKTFVPSCPETGIGLNSEGFVRWSRSLGYGPWPRRCQVICKKSRLCILRAAWHRAFVPPGT